MAFTPEPHSFTRKLKCIPWMVCSHCGMIRLRNPMSDWCAKNGCNHTEHPSYEAERMKILSHHEFYKLMEIIGDQNSEAFHRLK